MRRALLLGAILSVVPAGAAADSFDPVRLAVKVRLVGRAHKPLKLRVTVTADPGVLDPRSGSIRARVKLASTTLCGADFATTTGRVLLDKRFKHQPQPGRAYTASVKAKRRPRIRGTHPLCVFITDDYKQFASDTTSYTLRVRR